MLSAIDDWEEVQDPDAASLVTRCQSRYWLHRAESIAVCLLQGLSATIEVDTIEHLEEILNTQELADLCLNRLLIAPLLNAHRAERLAQQSLARGCTATAALFDRLWTRQPLLNRLVSNWLTIPPRMIVSLNSPLADWWLRLVQSTTFLKLLDASDPATLRTTWNTLALSETIPSVIMAIGNIGSYLADQSFPLSANGGMERVLADDSSFPEEITGDGHRSSPASHLAYQRAINQVNAIATAVAQGKDREARRILNKLIEEQTRDNETKYALKSLCNLAQKCADMFRTDFERLCLERALQIGSDDAWTLIQWGNHLKVIGEYDAAIEALDRAVGSEHDRVALSSKADVWTERGRFDLAAEVYTTIPNYSEVVEIRTGLADLLRKMGRLDEAEAEYNRIEKTWPEDSHRAVAGRAEVAKQRGKLAESLDIYSWLLTSSGLIIDPRSRLIYRLTKCQLLKELSHFEEAFSVADEIVKEAPFLMTARVIRGATHALLGRIQQGLLDLPTFGRMDSPNAPIIAGAWPAQYIQGLILLKLKRYEKAKRAVLAGLRSSQGTRRGNALMRLAAAFMYLVESNPDLAASELDLVGHLDDCLPRYVHHRLKLHLSVQRSDETAMARLTQELEEACGRDEALQTAVMALRNRDFSAARDCELNLLLRVAA
ncbi:MAG: tetratricopeptide repeat protein [Thermoguttaceae bacterium]